MTALWDRQAAWRGSVELAEPLAYLPDERILAQGPLPEEMTLKELARTAFADDRPEGLARLRAELARTARALAVLHGSGAAYGRTATFEDEVEEVREVIGRLALSVPELGAAAEPLLETLEEMARTHPADPIVPAHHDFRPAQVLLHEGTLGFIDFDGASMAEPALDLGRFRAKLRDIGISSLIYTGQPLSGAPLEDNLALLDELCEDFLAAYQQLAPVSRQRVLMWESCDLLTGLLHAWTKVRLVRVEPRLTVLLHQLRASGLAGRAD
jgi:aminoglycoside phosphotransferase (APT) family kinase protein